MIRMICSRDDIKISEMIRWCITMNDMNDMNDKNDMNDMNDMFKG